MSFHNPPLTGDCVIGTCSAELSSYGAPLITTKYTPYGEDFHTDIHLYSDPSLPVEYSTGFRRRFPYCDEYHGPDVMACQGCERVSPSRNYFDMTMKYFDILYSIKNNRPILYRVPEPTKIREWCYAPENEVYFYYSGYKSIPQQLGFSKFSHSLNSKINKLRYVIPPTKIYDSEMGIFRYEQGKAPSKNYMKHLIPKLKKRVDKM